MTGIENDALQRICVFGVNDTIVGSAKV